MAGLHAVQPAATFRWDQGGVQHDALDPVPQALDHARHDEPARRMGDEDDPVGDGSGIDVRQHRRHFVVDGDGRQIRGVVAAAWEVDGQRRARQQGNEAVPEPPRRSAAVHENVGHG